MPPNEKPAPVLEPLQEAAVHIHRGRTLEAVLEAVSAGARELLRAEHALVWLFDAEWGDLRGRRSPGEDEFRFPVGTGLAGRVARTRKPLRAANAPEEPGYDGEVDSPPSGEAPAFMAVPLLDESGALVGLLETLSAEGREFSDDDERCAALLAQHAAAAVGNVTARERERRLLLDLTAALADAVDRRSPATLDHTYRVREYCRKLGRAAGLDADSQVALELAALLHGVGRSEVVVREAPEGRSVDTARERLEPQAAFAEALLRGVRFPGAFSRVPEAVLHCLRSAAGSGSPRGKASAIARMLCIADAYDVHLLGRGVGEAATARETEALGYLQREAGKLFDADYVRIFVDRRCHVIEQRRFPRMDYETPVDVTVLRPDGGEERSFRTEALDLSEGGVLLRSAELIEPGTPVRLAIHLPSGEMEAVAKVARVLPGVQPGPDGSAGEGPGEGASRRIGVYFLWYGPAGS